MAVTYTTDGVHPRERIAYWREVMIKDLPRHDFRSHVGSREFHGTIQAGALGTMRVVTIESDPGDHSRSRGDVARCDNDDIILCLQQSGRMRARQSRREAVVEAGNFTLLDAGRTCGATQLTKVRLAVFSLPRRGLETRIGDVSALTARAMTAQQPLVGLAAGFLAMLPDRLDALAGPNGFAIAEQALDLVALALSSEAGPRGVALSSSRSIALMNLKALIEGRLCDSDLRPATLAAKIGIPPRYANQLLSAEGTSLERYILHRRLERCRQAFEDASQTRRMIGDIALSWGFSDLSHFGRRFRAVYGMTPGDYRRRAQEAAVAAGPAIDGKEARHDNVISGGRGSSVR